MERPGPLILRLQHPVRRFTVLRDFALALSPIPKLAHPDDNIVALRLAYILRGSYWVAVGEIGDG